MTNLKFESHAGGPVRFFLLGAVGEQEESNL